MELSDQLISIKSNFEARAQEVRQLMVFDDIILQHAITLLEVLDQRLEQHHNITNPRLTAQKAISSLQQVKENGSLKRHYSLMYNQCAVLLVSFFGATIHDIFSVAAAHKLSSDISNKARKHKFSFSLGELSDVGFDLSSQVGELVIRKADISFQDMQSIARAFEQFVGVKIERDRTVNNIIAVQACRHAIAHSGGIVNESLLNQLRGATDRTLFTHLELEEQIEFTEEDIGYAAAEMKSYVETVTNLVLDA